MLENLQSGEFQIGRFTHVVEIDTYSILLILGGILLLIIAAAILRAII